MTKLSKFLKILILMLSCTVLLSGNAYAYLDPGTGSMILQGILGGLAAAAVVIRLYWYRLLSFFGIKKNKGTQKNVSKEESAGNDSTN